MELKSLTKEQLNRVISRQMFLEETAYYYYDMYVKKQSFSEWWQVNLWNYLGLGDKNGTNS